jgi:hypothetical protein
MAVRIEDAGFEIRDMIAWVYASGFPKSLDVSKAIDKMDAAQEQETRQLRFTAWVRSTGVTARQIDEATGTNMGGHYTTAASQPAIMTREHLDACRHLLGLVPEWVEREADIRSVESRNFAEREILGVQKGAMAGWSMDGGTKFIDRNITAPATEAARQWAGWGTALKPALEPITVARKPLIGTVAENVLAHGTGALNVDGCRVKLAADEDATALQARSGGVRGFANEYVGGKAKGAPPTDMRAGRWPANLIHDGSEEVVGLFPQSKSTGGQASLGAFRNGDVYGKGRDERETRDPGYGDSGSAARFFYCAKASAKDRDEGVAGVAGVAGVGALRDGGRQSLPRKNHHPTVKPTDLMRYLCRLVTPPGGTVLDPFMGSGSTGKAAMLEGFDFIGIERDPEYVKIAEARIGAARRLL